MFFFVLQGGGGAPRLVWRRVLRRVGEQAGFVTFEVAAGRGGRARALYLAQVGALGGN